LHLQRDDGARVFLNGIEVIRDNLDRWWTGGYSPALKDVEGADETYFHTWQLNPALFKEGENVIAVEIHQVSATSPDLSFNLDLMATHLKGDTTFSSVDNKLSLCLTDNTSVTAYIIPEPNVVERVFINELMAKNSSGYTDENGEYEDWIELYNQGIAPVDLAGLYLTDTLPAQKAWQIPSGYPEVTTILPDGYMVFVADNETSEGLLHTSFKLDKDGDEVALLQLVGKDTIVIDHLQFGRQYANISWGRYPDGSETLWYMPVSTPLDANFREPIIIPSTALPLLSEDISIYPNPTHGGLFVKFNAEFRSENVPVQIYVYSGTGRLISMTQHISSEFIELSLENQSKGLYLVRILTGSREFERRIVVY
jgi:hypothetical protein